MKKLLRNKQFFMRLKEKAFCRTLFRIAVAILVLYLVCGIAIGVQLCVEDYVNNLDVTNDLNATWVASLPSYWGGILGGVISGLLAVIGVVWTISYYKKSDIEKTRIENMPFLAIQEVHCYNDGGGIRRLKIYSKTINKKEIVPEEVRSCEITLKNIGKGFAYATALCANNEKVEWDNKLLQINDQCKICFDVYLNKETADNEINLAINYADCMASEYIQEYRLHWKNYDKYNPEVYNEFPRFKGQIHDIGKVND